MELFFEKMRQYFYQSLESLFLRLIDFLKIDPNELLDDLGGGTSFICSLEEDFKNSHPVSKPLSEIKGTEELIPILSQLSGFDFFQTPKLFNETSLPEPESPQILPKGSQNTLWEPKL